MDKFLLLRILSTRDIILGLGIIDLLINYIQFRYINIFFIIFAGIGMYGIKTFDKNKTMIYIVYNIIACLINLFSYNINKFLVFFTIIWYFMILRYVFSYYYILSDTIKEDLDSIKYDLCTYYL